MVTQLVLVRHGQSVYNEENKFTGWVDVELTAAGLQEAVKASSTLLQGGLTDTPCDSEHRSLGRRRASF